MGSATSPAMAATCVSRASSSRAARNRSASRPLMTRFHSRRASARASASPSPREAPVISAVRKMVEVSLGMLAPPLMPATIPSTTSRRSKPGGIARGGRTWAGKRTGRHLSIGTGAALHATGSEGRQPCLDRAGDCFGAIGSTELREESADVELHGALAHAERGGDLLVAAAPREKLQDVGLARREHDLLGRQCVAAASARRDMLEYARCDDGLQERAAGMHGSNRCEDLGARHAFEEIALRPRLDSGDDALVGVEH